MGKYDGEKLGRMLKVSPQYFATPKNRLNVNSQRNLKSQKKLSVWGLMGKSYKENETWKSAQSFATIFHQSQKLTKC